MFIALRPTFTVSQLGEFSAPSSVESTTAGSLTSPLVSEIPNDQSQRAQTFPEQVPRARCLLRALLRTYGPACAISGVFKLIFDILQFAGPLLLKELAIFLQSSGDP